MAFFNEIGKKISQAGQDAVKSTKDLADIARLNSHISEEQKLLNSFYMQIGKKYFELFSENPNEEFSAYCTSISESMVKITEFRNEIQKIKGIKKCANCGAEVPRATTFCGSCGFDTTTASSGGTTADSQRKCSNCNKVLPENIAFCTDCGQKL